MKNAILTLATLTLFFSQIISQTAGDFRSFQTGNWNALTTWERFDGTNWVNPAPSIPGSADGLITIRNTHTVTITANPLAGIDQVTIDVGGTLTSSGATPTTIANGAGTDLIINGTFIDNYAAATNVITWAGTWSFGANGTLVKTTASSSNNWQTNYQGGAVNMPATANWILRRNSAVNISVSTTPLGPGVGAYYPNLIIENNVAGLWTTTAASSFSTASTSAYPIIKGNLDVGGTGTSTVSFLNGHMYTGGNSTLVQGNIIIRNGSTLRNYGNGIEVQGNITCNGTITYTAGTGNRNLIFSGGNAQNLLIGGTGIFEIRNLQMNKLANTLTLNSSITIDNQATFTSGIINSSMTNLVILPSVTTVSGASNNSFVNGPVRRLGATGITFPIGKSGSYRPLILNNGSGSTPFWTEDFGTASCAARGTLANGFVSANGTWTQTNGANGAAANEWYVSPTEANMGLGGCGDGCENDPTLTNSTLHLSAIGGLCGTPDCGSAYNATNANHITDKRVESPIINCTGQSSIQMSFLYIGNGENTVDNFTVWYFDGTTWSQIADPAVSGLCGPLCGLGLCQGVWTNFTVSLPASANNNPNVRIGFRWVNNGNGAGSDPSAGIDDIRLISLNNSIFTAEYFPTNPQVPYGNILAPTLTALSDCEYWILDRNLGTEARVVGLTWNAATCYNTDHPSFEVARYDGISTWQDHDGISVGVPAAGVVTTPVAIANFSPLAIAYIPTPLPVEMLNISAICENGLGIISWETASEINNSHFIIERSSDAIHWTEIGRKEGSGNSNSLLSYTWSDINPIEKSYFRLKQVDFDGQYKIYDPIYLECESKEQWVNIYPNPSNGLIQIKLSKGVQLDVFMIYSSMGQPIVSPTISSIKGSDITSIDISYLESGTYYLKLLVNGEWLTRPVVVIK